MQLAPGVAGDLGDPALDRGMDVLVVGGEGERPRDQLALHPVERGEQLGHLGLVEQAAATQSADMGTGPGQVVEGQLPVDVQARRVRP